MQATGTKPLGYVPGGPEHAPNRPACLQTLLVARRRLCTCMAVAFWRKGDSGARVGLTSRRFRLSPIPRPARVPLLRFAAPTDGLGLSESAKASRHRPARFRPRSAARRSEEHTSEL